MKNNDKVQIAMLLQQGYGYKKIASILGLNINTVKSHIRRFHKNENLRFECEQCGKQIPPGTKSRPRRFCSDACRSKWWNKHKNENKPKSGILYICQYCGKEFRDAKSKDRKFCSKDCFWQSRRDCFYEKRQESDAIAAPCGTELSDLPSDCMCASCKWFVDEKRACCCKKALVEKI